MLKQKVSAPVQEVILPDFPDDDTTFTTTVTKSRRVSFGPNFVKEFIADSAVSAQCMTEYEQPFPSSDSSSADSSAHSTFVVHDSAKPQLEVNENRFKPPKFASTICFSTDSPTADMEFTEGCITLAKSILDKKNKEMSVFIQAKSKEPKEEEKAKEEETNYFDGSQFEMSMTGCMRSKESKRDERRFVSEKTRIFGRYENEMSMTRCERFTKEGESDQSMEETKDSRMLLDAIMRHLDKDSSDSDLFNPERSFKRLGVNPFDLSDELYLNESMEISGEVNRDVAVERAVERSRGEAENLINSSSEFRSSVNERSSDLKNVGVRLEEVNMANDSKESFEENDPVANCYENSSEPMEISFDVHQNGSEEKEAPGGDENPIDAVEHPENPEQNVQDTSAGVHPSEIKMNLSENVGMPQQSEQDLSSAVRISDRNGDESRRTAGLSENSQQSVEQDASALGQPPEIGDENAGNSQQSLPEDLSCAAPPQETRDENPRGGVRLEETGTEVQNSERSIQQDFSSEIPQPGNSTAEISKNPVTFEETSTVSAAVVENAPLLGGEIGDVSCGSLSCVMPETCAESQTEEPGTNQPVEDMDITGIDQVAPEDAASREEPEKASVEVRQQLPSVETEKEPAGGEIPMEEDESSREPVLGDLKVIESLKEQSKEPGCVWLLKDLQHPGRRTEGLLTFSCRLLESTTSVQFTLKMSEEDSLDSCSIVTNSSIFLDEEKEWKLPEYALVVGFGFEELKKHFEGHRQRVEKIRHVPYFLDEVNSFLWKMNAYLQQIYSVLTLYPGSRLRGCRLFFRLFSFPIFFSCVVGIDLSNMFRLSRASLSFEHDFGGLDERTVGEIFEECLKRDNSLCEFVVQATRYLIELERESGYVSKRGHIRLLPEELK